MRFRGVIFDVQQIHSFIKVLQSFGRFSDTFLLRLSENEIQLLNDRIQTSPSFIVKSVMKCEDYFQEYKFNGVPTDHNLICFRLRSEGLTQVLSSLLPNIKALKLKLSKKAGMGSHDTVLNISVDYPTHDYDRYVCHQIKIDIIRSEEWDETNGQDFNQFDLSVYLPDPRLVCATTERLTDFCSHIRIRAKKEDTDSDKAILAISVDTDSISVKTKFKHLNLNSNQDLDPITNTTDSLVGIRIDVRKMNLIFNTLKHLKPTSIISNISDNNLICFQFFHNLVHFRAILPNIQ